MGTGTWSVLGSDSLSSGVPWDIAVSTNLTLNSQTSTLNFTNNDAGPSNEITMKGGGKTYYNVAFTGTSYAPPIYIYGSNTFNSFTTDDDMDLYFESGSTNTFYIVGIPPTRGIRSSGGTGILRSITSGSQAYLVYTGSSKVKLDYRSSVRDINGYPAQTWYAGTNSTNNGNNKDIYFYDAEPYFKAGNGPTTWLQFL